LSEVAGREEIRAAYLRLLKIKKPDRDPEGFASLRAAYELLSRGSPPLTAAAARPAAELEGTPPVNEAHAWLRGALEEIGPDPLRAIERLRVLDSVHADFPRDPFVTLLFLEELFTAGFVEDAAVVMTEYLRAEGKTLGSEAIWRWGTRSLPERLGGSVPGLELTLALLREYDQAGQRAAVTALLRAYLRAEGTSGSSLEVWRWGLERAPDSFDGILLEGAPSALGIERLMGVCSLLVDRYDDPFRGGQLLRRLIANAAVSELTPLAPRVGRLVLEVARRRWVNLAVELAKLFYDTLPTEEAGVLVDWASLQASLPPEALRQLADALLRSSELPTRVEYDLAPHVIIDLLERVAQSPRLASRLANALPPAPPPEALSAPSPTPPEVRLGRRSLAPPRSSRRSTRPNMRIHEAPLPPVRAETPPPPKEPGSRPGWQVWLWFWFILIGFVAMVTLMERRHF